MGIIILLGLFFWFCIGWMMIAFGFLIQPRQKKAIETAYALLKQTSPDPEAVKKAMRAFAYSTNETKELIHRLMAKISP